MKRIAWGPILIVPFLVASHATAQETVMAGPPVRSSWTSDKLQIRQGDIITILVDELTLATADRDDQNARERDRDLSLRGGFGDTSLEGGLRTGNDVSNRTRGGASRRERFTAEISVQVVELLPNGIARVEGKKKVQIDKHEQEVTVRGFVRTQDVSSANTIESWRVANAELLYDSNEELGKAGGIWSKLLDMIFP